jgi:hypothetical protein
MKSPVVPLLLTSLTAFTVAANGCIIYDDNDPPPAPVDPYGDIAFDWSFDGIPTCDEAGVDEVDVAIFQDGVVVIDHQREPCEGGGLVFTEIHSGFYEVFIDAYDRNGTVLYSGNFAIRVEGGTTNDAGVVVLEDINAPEPLPPANHALGAFWVFPYPSDTAITFDCALAGVEEVDIDLIPLGNDGIPYVDTFDCDAEGVLIEGLPEGRYELQMLGFGSYHDDAVLLYDSGIITVDITENGQFFDDQTGIVELGDVVLERDPEMFSDFDVSWGFVDDTCATVGLEDVTLSFQRSTHDQPEDAITVDCAASGVLRPTFVPGSYDVSVAGIAADETLWLGTTTVDLPPGAVAEVDLVIAPQ